MLQPRLIPCLLVHNGGLIKTQQFGQPKYVGDPLNAVRIFNEKEVDELIVLDIDATAEGREPDYRMIESLASECRMPLCYGGGVTRPEQGQRIVQLGVEKVAMSSVLVDSPDVASRMAALIGGQSVVAVLDVRRDQKSGRVQIFTRNGTIATGLDPAAFAARLEASGVGEIVVNSIDRDGMRTGYDFELIRSVRSATSVPITALGGAASLADVRALFDEHGIIGASAGSMFVFKGTYRAVLINYPNPSERTWLAKR